VLGEVGDVTLKADVAADELGEPGVGEGRDGTCPDGHLPDDLHHPLRTNGTVRPRQVGAPGGNLTRSPLRKPFGKRLAVLDESLVRQDRCAQGLDRLVGEPQLGEVSEGLQEDRVSPAFEERFGLLQKDGHRPIWTDGTYRDERTSERTDGPEDKRPLPRSCDGTGRLAGQPGALGVYFAHPLLEVVGLQLETVGGESVGLYGVGASPQILHMDIRDHLWVGEVRTGVGVADAAFAEQRAHGTVPDQDSRLEKLSQVRTQGKDLSPYSSHIRGGERLRLIFHLICRSLLRGSWHPPRGSIASPVAAASQGPSLRRSR
jgi:hypothetical protein